MNGIITLALVCLGIAIVGVVGLLWDWLGKRPAIRKIADKFLSTLPLMDGE